MVNDLPTKQQLEKLPLRAVVAYASRTARRLSVELRGVLPDEVLDHALQLAEAVTTTVDPSELEAAAIIRGAERVIAACNSLVEERKPRDTFRIAFSITQSAIAAMSACQAAVDPANTRLYMKRTLEAAQRALRAVEALDSTRSTAATEAARRDYETLLATYGEHEEPILGDPVHCFDNVRE